MEFEGKNPSVKHQNHPRRPSDGGASCYMRLDDLRPIHTNDELSYLPGKRALRYKAFSPYLENLFEGKVVYLERFICIACLDNLKITKTGFSAIAVPQIQIHRAAFLIDFPKEPWRFAGTWENIRLLHNCFNAPMSGWTIWPESERVQAVENAAKQSDWNTALSLTLHQLGAT